MNYEVLLKESDLLGLTTKEKTLKHNNGRIKEKRITIRKDIKTTTEKHIEYKNLKQSTIWLYNMAE